MRLQSINFTSSNYKNTVKNQQINKQNSFINDTIQAATSQGVYAPNYFNNISFGNKLSQFIVGDNQDLYLDLSDKSKQATKVSISAIRISGRRREHDIISTTSNSKLANGSFRLPVGYFDPVDNSPYQKVALQHAVFFDIKGNPIEELRLVQTGEVNGKPTYKTVRIIGDKQENLDKNIVFSPAEKSKEVKLKSVIIGDFESQSEIEIFATAKTKGKLKIFDSYDELKNYDGENVIAILTKEATEAMFNDMIMETMMNIKSPEYQKKLDSLKTKLDSGEITKETYDKELEVQKQLNEDFFLPLNIKGLIAPFQKGIDITGLFSSLGHVRARLQNRQSVLFATPEFTKLLQDKYSDNDTIELSVFPTGLKIKKSTSASTNDSCVELNKPQYVNRLLTFEDSEADYNEASTGVKANNLRILSILADELGVKIPDTFVIPAGFTKRMGLDLSKNEISQLDTIYKQSLNATGENKKLLRLQLQEKLKRMQLSIINKTIPEDCKLELEDMLIQLGFDKEKGIVRSSMNGEDNKDLQTAGLYDSVMFDGLDEFWDSMKQVAASKWSYMAYMSRMKNQIPHDDVSINMPVQKLVDGDYIGTAYTADARVGDTNKLIVQIAPGIDCTIPGTPYTFRTDTLSGDVERTLARKQRKKPLQKMSKADREKKLDYSLTDYSIDFWNRTPDEYRPELRKINNVLKKIRQAFGAEQDVEFVLKLARDKNGIATEIQDIYVVQTRDIKM